jgi:hypothetical protein
MFGLRSGATAGTFETDDITNFDFDESIVTK